MRFKFALFCRWTGDCSDKYQTSDFHPFVFVDVSKTHFRLWVAELVILFSMSQCAPKCCSIVCSSCDDAVAFETWSTEVLPPPFTLWYEWHPGRWKQPQPVLTCVCTFCFIRSSFLFVQVFYTVIFIAATFHLLDVVTERGINKKSAFSLLSHFSHHFCSLIDFWLSVRRVCQTSHVRIHGRAGVAVYFGHNHFNTASNRHLQCKSNYRYGVTNR